MDKKYVYLIVMKARGTRIPEFIDTSIHRAFLKEEDAEKCRKEFESECGGNYGRFIVRFEVIKMELM